MSDTIITNIEAPEGMEAYLDGGTVKFRTKTPEPETLLEIEHKIQNAQNQQVLFEAWNASRWEPQVGDRNSFHLGALLQGKEDRLRRNPRSYRQFTITIAHPDEEWVKTATKLLVDYLDTYLVEATADEVECDYG